MIVGNRERENAPTTFTISKTVETSGVTAVATDELNKQISDLTKSSTSLKNQFDALMYTSGAEIAKLKTDLAAVRSEPSAVGTVIQSLLTEAEFTTEAGTAWVLADGRSAAGTRYATITKRTTVPDLRGAFLRGAGTRAANTAWAGGTLNTFVEDSTKAPTNAFWVTARDPIRQGDSGRGLSGSASYSSGEAYLRPGTSTNNVGGGDPETRPKHYVVNYFIKVN